MLKNAAALTAVALGAASPASAHYKGYYNFSLYAGFELPLRDASSHAEDLGPRTLQDRLSLRQDLLLAALARPRVAPHARANEGCRLSPQGGGPSFLLAEIERLTAT